MRNLFQRHRRANPASTCDIVSVIDSDEADHVPFDRYDGADDIYEASVADIVTWAKEHGYREALPRQRSYGLGQVTLGALFDEADVFFAFSHGAAEKALVTINEELGAPAPVFPR